MLCEVVYTPCSGCINCTTIVLHSLIGFMAGDLVSFLVPGVKQECFANFFYFIHAGPRDFLDLLKELWHFPGFGFFSFVASY